MKIKERIKQWRLKVEEREKGRRREKSKWKKRVEEMYEKEEWKKTECNFNRFTSNLQGPPGDRGMRGEIGTFGFKVRNKMLYLLKSRYIV